MNKKIFKFAAFLVAFIMTIGCTAPLGASAAEMASNQERFEYARTQVLETLISMLEQNGYSKAKARSMTIEYAEKNARDCLFYCTVKENYSMNSNLNGEAETIMTYSDLNLTYKGYRTGRFFNTWLPDNPPTPPSPNQLGTSHTYTLDSHCSWNSGATVGRQFVFCNFFTTTSSSVPPSSAFCVNEESFYLEYCIDRLGDFNGDGKVSTNDVQKIVDHVAYNQAHLTDPNWYYYDNVIGDINADGTANTMDAYELLVFIDNTDISLYSVWS